MLINFPCLSRTDLPSSIISHSEKFITTYAKRAFWKPQNIIWCNLIQQGSGNGISSSTCYSPPRDVSFADVAEYIIFESILKLNLFSWTDTICRFICCFWDELYLQMPHLNGFFPSWTDATYSYHSFENSSSHKCYIWTAISLHELILQFSYYCGLNAS